MAFLHHKDNHNHHLSRDHPKNDVPRKIAAQKKQPISILRDEKDLY